MMIVPNVFLLYIYISIPLEFEDKFFFLGESVYRYDIMICWIFHRYFFPVIGNSLLR